MNSEFITQLGALTDAYVPGKTLPQKLYTQPEIFEYEMAHVLNDTWFYARHSSELPNVGDYAVLQIGRASIFIIRGQDGVVRGFHNVCGHRAAKLCLESSGSMKRITCPYHSWTYGLDGSLLATQFMAPDFNRHDHPLRPVTVGEECGMILVNLSDDRPFEEVMAPNRDTLLYYGMDTARVVARRSYMINANWKLAIENFTECYHCAPSHKLLTKIMGKDQTLRGIDIEDPTARAAADRAKPRVDAMNERLDSYRGAGDAIPHGPRQPLAEGVESGTADGKMVVAPMTPAGRTVGTETFAIFDVHNGFLNFYEDYAVAVIYIPLSHDKTLVESTWYINGSIAMPDADTIEKITALWDITTREDSWLTENQVDGVNSPFYRPGTLSTAEFGPRAFLDWYIGRLTQSLAPSQTPTLVEA